jgi:hypothetical protein
MSSCGANTRRLFSPVPHAVTSIDVPINTTRIHQNRIRILVIIIIIIIIIVIISLSSPFSLPNKLLLYPPIQLANQSITHTFYSSYLSNTNAQLVPPKPKLLDMARLNPPSCRFVRMFMPSASSTRS